MQSRHLLRTVCVQGFRGTLLLSCARRVRSSPRDGTAWRRACATRQDRISRSAGYNFRASCAKRQYFASLRSSHDIFVRTYCGVCAAGRCTFEKVAGPPRGPRFDRLERPRRIRMRCSAHSYRPGSRGGGDYIACRRNLGLCRASNMSR